MNVNELVTQAKGGNKYALAVISIAVFVLIYAGWHFLISPSTDLPDNGKRIDQIGAELGTLTGQNNEARNDARQVTEGLEADAGRAGSISEGIGRVSEGIKGSTIKLDEIREDLTEGRNQLNTIREIIEDDRRIYRTIRQRSQSGN